MLPPTPTPPLTTNAPEFVPVDGAVLVIVSVPARLILPPTYKSLPIPTPPVTWTAPVFGLDDVCVFVNETMLLVVAPLFVIDCKVLVFHTTILPEVELTTVSVPAVRLSTPVFVNANVEDVPTIVPPPLMPGPTFNVILVITRLPLSNNLFARTS